MDWIFTDWGRIFLIRVNPLGSVKSVYFCYRMRLGGDWQKEGLLPRMGRRTRMVGSWGMGWGGFGEVGGCPTNDSRYPPYSRSSAVTANGGDDANGWFVGGWVGVDDAQIDGHPTSDSRYPCIRGHRVLPRMGRMTRMVGSLGDGLGWVMHKLTGVRPAIRAILVFAVIGCYREWGG